MGQDLLAYSTPYFQYTVRTIPIRYLYADDHTDIKQQMLGSAMVLILDGISYLVAHA